MCHVGFPIIATLLCISQSLHFDWPGTMGSHQKVVKKLAKTNEKVCLVATPRSAVP